MTRVAVVFGTFNRFELLKRAVASVRKAAGCLRCELIVVDGGSTDGSREWLAQQPDVTLIGQRGPLTGAVGAFNLGFGYAVDQNFDFVMHLNDDAEIVTDRAIEEAVRILQGNPKIGEVAFAFDLYGSWSFDHVNGKPYGNFGVIRLAAGKAVAQAQGDSTGRAWWNPRYRTYGADSEFGVWLWKLGWEVYTASNLQVHDAQAMDTLRANNEAANPNRIDSQLFWTRWGNEDYTTADLPIPNTAPRPIVSTKLVLVTGGYGFLGKAVVRQLKTDPGLEVSTFHSAQFDLTDRAQTKALFQAVRPRVVYHLAARCGGIGANQVNPATFFQDNMQMGMNVLEAARDQHVERVVLVGTVCAYPKHTPTPFTEDNLWQGYPEETNAPYGIAKRSLGVLAEAYQRQFGLNVSTAILANLYGPEDNFDLTTSHVIPALIRKFVEAKRTNADTVTLWGSGDPTREFLYVDDAACALKLLAERPIQAPINVGVGHSISIMGLAILIKDLIGFEGIIHWDTTKPDGQPYRYLDISRATALGFTAKISLPEGLKKTIDWYAAKTNASRS